MRGVMDSAVQRFPPVRIVFCLLTLLWMIVIFLFSAQNGQQSEATSSGVVDRVAALIVKDYEEFDEATKVEVRQELSFAVRKMGHFTEYALLGVLTFGAVSKRERARWLSALFTFGICVAYAAGDEFHQFFSDGRSPALWDVLIDSSGALVGIAIALLLWLLIDWFGRRYLQKRTG